MKPSSLKSHLAKWRILEVTLVEDSEFCRELGIHPSTSRRWRRTKKIRYLKIDRKIYYRMSDLLPFIAQVSLRNKSTDSS